MKVHHTLIWHYLSATTRIVGLAPGISPHTLTKSGIVLGTTNDHQGRNSSFIAETGKQWVRLFSEPGFYATDMNDMGDIVGVVIRDGYWQPWLRRVSGQMVWLPYFDQHWCRPCAINNSGVIVGDARTDHGSHALIWCHHDKNKGKS